MFYQKILKNLLDLVVSAVLLVMVLPLLAVLSILLAFSFKGNPFFIQKRVGKEDEIFKIIKFRTMNNNKDGNGDLLPDSKRLTTLGSLVRKTSLDEIPQLLNVMKGDMSFVGPRPLLVEYLPLYNTEQRRRHTVRPGITGWTAVNGRNGNDWVTKFKLDVYYVENISIVLDLKIVWMTMVKVFMSEGISSGTSVTMEKFTGME
jgi:undecaprenyl phosphate N,N'-diacetylbacillosamine 1-phosphate transferase